MFFVLIVSIVVILWYRLNVSKIRRDGKRLRRPPNTLPILGNGILFLQDRHKLFSWFVKCERMFGFETFEISVPSLPPGVVINDPRNLEFVLKNESLFSKGEFFKRRSWDLFGNGIINADGNLWRLQRKAGLQFLSNSNLKVLSDVALPQYLSNAMAVLDNLQPNEVVNLDIIVHEITTQLMGRMAYNMDIHAEDSFAMCFEHASKVTAERFQNPLYQLTELLLGHRFRGSIRVVKDFGRNIVSNAVSSQAQQISSEKEDCPVDSISGSLISCLIGSIGDHQMVADAALNYLSAGRDTTGQGLTWTFYLLMSFPAVADRICNEITKLRQREGISEDAIIPPGLLKPYNLPYTVAVFCEALRLYPPVPFELKQAQETTTLPDGTNLPKGAIVVWCTWAMDRSELIWGPDSSLFRPERWLEDDKLITKSAFEYPVFNAGPRTCLGKKMAEVMAVQILATLVPKYRFVPTDEKERITENSLTLPMKDGLPCFVKRRA